MKWEAFDSGVYSPAAVAAEFRAHFYKSGECPCPECSVGQTDFAAVTRFIQRVVTMPGGREYTNVPCDDLRAVARELQRLYAIIVESEADTARLDWLSRNGWAEIVDVENGVQVGDVYAPDGDTRTLRQAIDEAMRDTT